MTWSELDADGTAWTIPGGRAKNGKEHIVPLSSQAQSILKDAPRLENEDKDDASPFVFPGRGGAFNGFSKAKAALDAASGVKEWRLHDLRRTMATGLQRLGVRLEVTEAVLNHISGSRAGIVGIYQRHDYAAEKRAALTAWGEHITAIVETREASDNVISLEARSA